MAFSKRVSGKVSWPRLLMVVLLAAWVAPGWSVAQGEQPTVRPTEGSRLTSALPADGVAVAAQAEEGGEPDDHSKSDAAEIKNLRGGMRLAPVFDYCGGLDRIGALTSSPFWTEMLSLSEEQISAITKLEDVVQEARVLSFYAAADHPADDLASYRAYIDRSITRRQKAILHAQRVVSLGILTEPQAAAVWQRYLTTTRPMYALYDGNIQEMLGMTERQKEELVRLVEDAPIFHRLATEKWPAAMLSLDTAVMGLLTPDQLKIWSGLTAQQPLPAEPPHLPSSAGSNAEAPRMKLPDESPVFRVLAKNPRYFLGISRYQRRLLDDLVEVTQEGVLRISLSHSGEDAASAPVSKDRAERISQKCAELVKHAEQVALLGILTEDQAKQVQAAI